MLDIRHFWYDNDFSLNAIRRPWHLDLLQDSCCFLWQVLLHIKLHI